MGFLDLIGITKYYGTESSAAAVHDFNLSVHQGEFVSLLGPSGCGKTTTLRMVAGFETPTAGHIMVDGADISNVPPNRRNVGMVFQSYALFPNMTVRDNIAFGLRVARRSATEIGQRVEEMLRLIHMPELGPRYPQQLSGGQQQRVALARALAPYPRVLLLDEPLSALDAKTRVELRGEIRQIQQNLGITTLYVTHDQEEALTISDRVVVMNAGAIEQIGTPVEIYNAPQSRFVASFVGTLNFLDAAVRDAAAGIVETEGQVYTLAAPLGGDRRDVAVVAVRPEQLSLVPGGGQTNQLKGKVVRSTLLGSVVRVQVAVGQHLVSCDVFNTPHLLLPQGGEEVTLYFSPESVLVLTGDS